VFTGLISIKVIYTKFDENPPSGSRVDAWGGADGRTDRYDGAKRCFMRLGKNA